jgi:hypothetical protein
MHAGLAAARINGTKIAFLECSINRFTQLNIIRRRDSKCHKYWISTSTQMRQGDQIGRIFARWVIVYFGQFFFKLQKKPNCLILELARKKLCINFDKKWVGLHFGQYLPKLIRSP